jgi:hypothetical protein
MIYCLNCGKGIPDQSKFCTFCGTAIGTAETKQPENSSPPVSQFANPTPPEQQYVPPTPPPQQFVPTTPPPPQYVNPTPPQQQQYVTPAQPVVQQYASTTPSTAGTVKNEFYKNAGFWGAVLAFIGFFLPYVTGYDVSFYYLVTDLAPDKPELYLYAVFPVCAAILIIQSFTGILPKFLMAICKILPILMLILLIVGASQSGSNLGFMGDDAETILKNIGVGLYMTVIGTILMLFFKTTKVKV